jgi:hypothetical protein
LLSRLLVGLVVLGATKPTTDAWRLLPGLARALQRPLEVRRQLGLELELFACERVLEAEPGAVEELASEAVASSLAVTGVPRHRVPDRREVDADLVGASRLQPGLDQRVVRQELDDGPPTARRSGAR